MGAGAGAMDCEQTIDNKDAKIRPRNKITPNETAIFIYQLFSLLKLYSLFNFFRTLKEKEKGERIVSNYGRVVITMRYVFLL